MRRKVGCQKQPVRLLRSHGDAPIPVRPFVRRQLTGAFHDKHVGFVENVEIAPQEVAVFAKLDLASFGLEPAIWSWHFREERGWYALAGMIAPTCVRGVVVPKAGAVCPDVKGQDVGAGTSAPRRLQPRTRLGASGRSGQGQSAAARPPRLRRGGAAAGLKVAPGREDVDVGAAALLTVQHGRPGVGPVTAMAIQAFAPPMESFRRGRDFSAWLGLVPKQHTTGRQAEAGQD